MKNRPTEQEVMKFVREQNRKLGRKSLWQTIKGWFVKE